MNGDENHRCRVENRNLTYMIFTDDLRKGTSRIRADSKILDREVSPHGA